MTTRRAKITLQPQAHQDLLIGINQVANLLAPTLGPFGGHVAGSANDNKKYEMWDDAGTTLRRLIALGTPQADIGAMLLRSMIWRLEQRVGDGGSTAAVLAREVTAQGMRLLAAGVNATELAKGLRSARDATIANLRAQAQPADDEEMLARVALCACGDPVLSAMLGEIRALVGGDGYVTIEKYVAPYLERRYVNGAYFGARMTSMHFYSDSVRRTATLAAPAVAVLEETLTTQEDAIALLEAALKLGAMSLLIVAQDVTGAALNLLVMNNQQPVETRKLAILAVKFTGAGAERVDQLRDLCALTGASLLGNFQQTAPRNAQPEHLGSATRVEWARDGLSVLAADERREPLRREAESVQQRLAHLDYDDDARPVLARRLGVLTGGIAELKIGAHSNIARDALHATAIRTLRLLSSAQRSGVVAGAGAAYLHAADALTRTNPALADLSDEAFAGVTLLARTLSAPLATIARNAGHDHPATVVASVREAGLAHTWDAHTGRVVNAAEAGILDALDVTTTVLGGAISCALMALTTDAIVYHKKPQQSLKI